MPQSLACGDAAPREGAARSPAVKLRDLDPQGRRFDPWCGHVEICTLSKALDPTLLQGVRLPLNLINCKPLWIKASAERHVTKWNEGTGTQTAAMTEVPKLG